MEQTNPKYTVVEVLIELKEGNQSDLLDKAMTIYIEECGSTGNSFTEMFDQMNFYNESGERKCHLNFIAPGHDFKKVEQSVRNFLRVFQEELYDEDLLEGWLDDLEAERLPIIEFCQISEARAYRW